jgi:excisionase family DNA binding protein
MYARDNREEFFTALLARSEAPYTALPHIFDCETLAAFLSVEVKTIQTLAHAGKIPCRKVGKSYRFFAPAVISWLAGPHGAVEGGS